MRHPLLAAAGLLCSSAACIVEAPGAPHSTPVSPEKARVLTGQATPLQLKLGANMEDKIEILGATIQPGTVVPGEQARVTAYYKVLAPVGDDYMVFVHVEDAEGSGHFERLNVDHAPGGGVRPSSQWQPGETIKDEFSVYVPPNSEVHSLNIFVGFWQPRTDARLRLKNVDR